MGNKQSSGPVLIGLEEMVEVERQHQQQQTSKAVPTTANAANGDAKTLLAMLIGRAPPQFADFANKTEQLKRDELQKAIMEEEIAYYSENGDEEEASASAADVAELILIQNIPLDVWRHLFGHLEDARDKINISNSTPYRRFLQDFRVCVNTPNADPYWKGMLHSSKTSWLFPMVFPNLLDHLSKNEILLCRLVCKHWCSGVDHFLENNAYQRPALEQMKRQVNGSHSTKIYNTDICLHLLMMSLDGKQLAYNNFYKAAKMKKLLMEANPLEKCPFVGKSANLLESRRYSYVPTNIQFLHVFGHHLWFLRVRFEDFTPEDCLTATLKMMVEVPNLKKLELLCIISPPKNNNNWESKNPWIAELSQNLPKLETLVVKILPLLHTELADMLFKLFGPNLQSLSANTVPEKFDWNMVNLTDLMLSLDSDHQLGSLTQLNSPLQRLSLTLCGRINAQLLFQVIWHFQQSLRSLSLNLQQEFFTGGIHTNLSEQLAEFMDPEALGDFHNLKIIYLISHRPFTLNFLCGLHNCLEYLHIYMRDLRLWQEFFEEAYPVQEWSEKLDLLDYLKLLPSSSKLVMYKSNVWSLLPRLKVLTVRLCSLEENMSGEEIEYRRDVYERYLRHDNKIEL